MSWQMGLVLALFAALGQAMGLLQAGWRLHTSQIGLLLALSGLLVSLLGAAPGSGGQLLALGLTVLLVGGPPLLAGLMRRHLADGQLAVAGLLARLRAMLCWSPATRVEVALIDALSAREPGGPGLAAALARLSRPEDRAAAIAPVLEQVVALDDSLARQLFERCELDARHLSEGLAYPFLQSYCRDRMLDQALSCQQALDGRREMAPELTLMGRVCIAAHFGTPEMVQGLFESHRGLLRDYPPMVEPFWVGLAYRNAGRPAESLSWFARAEELAGGGPMAETVSRTRQDTEQGLARGLVMPPPLPAAVDRVAEMLRGAPLEALAPARLQDPRPALVTWALLAVNALVFGLCQWPEFVGRQEPMAVLVRLGALVEGLVREGEHWRLITAQFLHAGWIHALCNGMALVTLGRVAERVYGPGKLLVLYLASGTVASLVSLAAGGYALSVGASGAICGLLGLLISAFMRRTGALPEGGRREVLRGLLLSGGLIVMVGAMVPWVDQGGHVGGGIAGFLFGWLAFPEGMRARTPARVRLLVWPLFVVGLLLIGWSGWKAWQNYRGAGYPRRLPALTRVSVPGSRVSIELPRFWVPALIRPVDRQLVYKEPWGSPGGMVWVLVQPDAEPEALAAQMRQELIDKGLPAEQIRTAHRIVDSGVVGLAWVLPSQPGYGSLFEKIRSSLTGER